MIPLYEIEQAIKLNCVMDTDSKKRLVLAKHSGVRNQGIGRSLFLFIAQHCGHDPGDICAYLRMTTDEYEHKSSQLEEYYSRGRVLFETVGPQATYNETADICLFFYRKLILISNYLKYRFNFKL